VEAQFVGSQSYHQAEDGILDLNLSENERSARVLARGHRMKRVGLSRATKRIVLPRGIPVTLTLPEDLELPQPPLFLAIDGFEFAIGGTGDTEYALAYATGLRTPEEPLDEEDPLFLFRPETRRLETLLPLAGTLAVRCAVIRLRRENDGRSVAGVLVSSATPLRIEVADSKEEQVFELPIDRDALSAALKATSR